MIPRIKLGEDLEYSNVTNIFDVLKITQVNFTITNHIQKVLWRRMVNIIMIPNVSTPLRDKLYNAKD